MDQEEVGGGVCVCVWWTITQSFKKCNIAIYDNINIC